MYKDLLIFRHTPIDVDVKMFEYFASELWEGNVYVFAETSFKSERSLCGYKESAKDISTIILDKSDVQINDDFFRNNKDSIFIFYGIPLANSYQEMLKKYNLDFGVISERDNSLCESSLKTRIRKLMPMFTYYKNKYVCNHVKCFLAMGEKGVECFNRYFGIRKNVMFNFMYNDGNTAILPTYRKNDKIVRLVYVGRFDYHYKGLNTLLDAVENVEGEFILDLFGGYGDDADDVRERAALLEHVNCYNSIPQSELCDVLNKYDVIIVPSNQDGWNLHCNIAVNAGIGAIATDEAVSHEIVKKCGNGRVVKAHDSIELRRVIQEVIESPECISEWKSNTIEYANRISYKTVAEYLMSELNYSFSNEITDRPHCPWL